MKSSNEYFNLVENLQSDIMKEKTLVEQKKLTLAIQSEELENLLSEVTKSVNGIEFQTTFNNIEKSIKKMETTLGVLNQFREEIIESVENPINTTLSIQSMIKNVIRGNQLPQRLLSEVEQLLSRLSDQSIDSIKKIRNELDKEIEREKMCMPLSDLHKSTMMNQCNLEKLKDRNKTIMQAYKEKIEAFNLNSSRITLIEKELIDKRHKLLQVESIVNLANEEILSWSFQISSLKSKTIKYDEGSIDKKKIMRYHIQKDSYLKALNKKVIQLVLDLNNIEQQYEDRISFYHKARKAIQAQELLNHLQFNFKQIPFYAILLKIQRNRAKKRNRDIELLSKVNEQIKQMHTIFESDYLLNLGLFSLDNRIQSMKESNEVSSQQIRGVLSLNEKYRYILVKKFDVYDY